MPGAAMLSRLHPAGFVEPCLPTPARAVPTGPQWAYEVKHDGYRFIARRHGDRVRVFSRNAKDWTDRVPAIVEAMLALPVRSATLDGEGVVVDDRGVTDFGELFAALARRGGTRAAFLYAFDVIEVDGDDVRDRPWEVRRATLTKILSKAPYGIRLSEHLGGCGDTIYAYACTLGAEGIVSKRRDRPYRSGRCADWVKVKNPDAPAATRALELVNRGRGMTTLLRRSSCSVALLASLLSTQASGDSTLTLACQGTTTWAVADAKPEPFRMSIMVDFTKGTVQGFGTPGSNLGDDFPLKITGMNDVTIAFGGQSRVLHVEWSINGTIDRVTGDVEATSTQTDAKTLQNVSSLIYTLKCRPTQRLF
jgi:bifunctional non-homologous end joining protein LigD